MAELTAIVVPVFNAATQTRRCLDALQATVSSRHTVIVINDASTDPEISALMRQLPEAWVQINNCRNLGFVGAANLGLSLSSPANVVLLNSDTQVTTGWLEAIVKCAQSDCHIASITPLSNNAEIASIPHFCQANPWPSDPESWARACRDSGPPVYTDVPTGVGFCMWINRACLDAIGAFDESAFGRGYGEENDWCMRAIQAGWRNVLCDHAYVAHSGSASFGPLGLKPGGHAMRTLLKRHPDYMKKVQSFIHRDPLCQRRKAIIEYHAAMSETSGPLREA